MAMWIHHLLTKVQQDETDEVDLQVLCLGGEAVSIKRPSLYAWVRPAQVGVRETSMQAWRKARRASHECEN